MQLRELQTQFTQATLSNDHASLPINDNHISASERLSVYHHNVIGGLHDVLSEIYTATRKLVGDEFFWQMAKDFIAITLPTESDLNRYGKHFSAFIASYEAAKVVPYLSDVAQFEWLWHEAYFAPDDAPLSAAEMNAIVPEDLQLQLRTSIKLFASNYPVDDIWRYCESGENAPKLDSGPVFLLLARPALEVITLRLTQPEYHFLSSIAQGNPLEKAAEGMEQHLSECLVRYFSVGLFKGRN